MEPTNPSGFHHLVCSKPAFAEQGLLKIGDFGLARTFRRGGDRNRGADRSVDGRFTNRVITLWYR